ncbi:MAG: hypothetical protein IANPNBLG_03502 [Bryobacteraceae bacterium]|nr:hypothetical protein [Bryobacteraceae bacterium]
MSKNEEFPVPSSPLSAQDERLEKLFDDMETGSLKTLEDAARQIITLSTALLGAFFGLLAFKDAPAYLAFLEIKIVGTGALLAFLISLFCALTAVSPKRYNFPQASLTAKRMALDEMLNCKHSAVTWASWIFGLGALLMLAAALDILIFRV